MVKKSNVIVMMILVFVLVPTFSYAKVIDLKSVRFVIFGDSLSDIGNYPEPADVASPKLMNFNLYVPISNPVPSKFYGQDFIPSITFLENSIVNRGRINGRPKTLYSINWPLYFIYNASQTQLMSWYQHYKNPLKKVSSLDYAWASAMARGRSGSNRCYHDNWNYFVGVCNRKSLVHFRDQYLKHTANDLNYDKNKHYLYNDLQIPDLGKQVSLYLNDEQVSVKNHTVFIIYIGANDITDFLRSRTVRLLVLPFDMNKPLIDRQMKVIVSSVVKAVSRIEEAYKNKGLSNYRFYILTVPKLSNAVESGSFKRIPLVGYKVVKILDYATKNYNTDLQIMFKDRQKVVVLNSGQQIDAIAKQLKYKTAVKQSKACIGDPSGDYVGLKKSNANCNYYYQGRWQTYFNWNNAHLVSQVDIQLARYLLGNVKVS